MQHYLIQKGNGLLENILFVVKLLETCFLGAYSSQCRKICYHVIFLLHNKQWPSLNNFSQHNLNLHIFAAHGEQNVISIPHNMSKPITDLYLPHR